jgi:GWxTD domain-containing protein
VRAAARVLGLAALLLVPAPVRAQGAAQVTRLFAWRDSLAGVTDTVALRRLEADMMEVARVQRDSTLLHLELGLLALRLGELGGRSHFEDAASEFEWAAELRPDWPFPWYALALAEQAIGDARFGPLAGVQAMLGKDKLSRAVSPLERALAVEPAFAPALVELARVAETQRFSIRLDAALAAFRVAGGAPETDRADVQLARGRVERLAGSPDSALVAFRRYERLGGLPGVALLEQARTLFVLDSLSGAEPYFAGAAPDDSASVAMYRTDIALIARPHELAAFDSARGRQRTDVLRRFWFTRDRADLRGDGERLREHYRRLHVARREYRLAVTRRRYDTDERYRSGSTEFDDRGIVFVRHGAADTVVTFPATGICANESWQYRRPDGNLLLHFVAREDIQDFRLVGSVLDVLGAGGIRTVRPELCGQGGSVGELLLSRAGLSPLYDQLLVAGPNNYLQFANADRAAGDAAIRASTTTDTYALRFGEGLWATADVLALGQEGGQPLLHVAFAVRGATARPVTTALGPAYALRVRLVALNEAGDVVASMDTARIHVTDRVLGLSDYLMGRVAVPVPPGAVRYRVAVSQGDERGVVLPSGVARPTLPGDTLALSDLALGGPDAGTRWLAADGEPVRMNPLGTYRADGTLELYAEAYGARPDGPMRLQVEVTREGGGGLFGLFRGRRSTSVSGTEQPTGPVTPIRRALSLAGLPPGNYRVSLRLSDASGRRLERARAFRIVRASPLSP